MKKEEFIESVANRMYNGKCDLFVGSGISSESNIPSWNDLLQPMTKELNLDLDEKDDLPLIAQYIVNNNSGNRNVIRTRLMEVFDRKYDINRYHLAIANMRINTIWTTNYDMLLEQCFVSREYHVVASDDDLGKPRNNDEEIEIVKIHGSIDKSLNEIVLTQEDYDRFIFRKPALAQRLRDNLIKNSILFVGYGYRDPDIRNIMIEAMSLMNSNSQEHYIILFDIKRGKNEKIEKFEQRKKRFNLWIKELNRLGIRELTINSSDKMTEILEEIALKSRGKNVFVTGSHNAKNSYTLELGKKLVDVDNITLLNGQSEGVGLNVLNGFMEECVERKMDMGNRVKIYPNPYAANAEFADRSELIPSLKKERRSLLSNVRVFVFFAGGMGTKAEIEVALEMQCVIIPGVVDEKDYENELIIEMLADDKIMHNIKVKDFCYYQLLNEKKLPSVKQLVDTIRGMMK